MNQRSKCENLYLNKTQTKSEGKTFSVLDLINCSVSLLTYTYTASSGSSCEKLFYLFNQFLFFVFLGKHQKFHHQSVYLDEIRFSLYTSMYSTV